MKIHFEYRDGNKNERCLITFNKFNHNKSNRFNNSKILWINVNNNPCLSILEYDDQSTSILTWVKMEDFDITKFKEYTKILMS